MKKEEIEKKKEKEKKGKKCIVRDAHGLDLDPMRNSCSNQGKKKKKNQVLDPNLE